MATHGRKHAKRAVKEYRMQHQHVVQMRPAGIGVVMQEQVAFVNVALKLGDHLLGRIRHGENMNWVVRKTLRDLTAIG